MAKFYQDSPGYDFEEFKKANLTLIDIQNALFPEFKNDLCKFAQLVDVLHDAYIEGGIQKYDRVFRQLDPWLQQRLRYFSAEHLKLFDDVFPGAAVMYWHDVWHEKNDVPDILKEIDKLIEGVETKSDLLNILEKVNELPGVGNALVTVGDTVISTGGKDLDRETAHRLANMGINVPGDYIK